MAKYDGLTYNDAFRAARDAGDATFQWRGNSYNTKVRVPQSSSKQDTAVEEYADGGEIRTMKGTKIKVGPEPGGRSSFITHGPKKPIKSKYAEVQTGTKEPLMQRDFSAPPPKEQVPSVGAPLDVTIISEGYTPQRSWEEPTGETYSTGGERVVNLRDPGSFVMYKNEMYANPGVLLEPAPSVGLKEAMPFNRLHVPDTPQPSVYPNPTFPSINVQQNVPAMMEIMDIGGTLEPGAVPFIPSITTAPIHTTIPPNLPYAEGDLTVGSFYPDDIRGRPLREPMPVGEGPSGVPSYGVPITAPNIPLTAPFEVPQRPATSGNIIQDWLGRQQSRIVQPWQIQQSEYPYMPWRDWMDITNVQPYANGGVVQPGLPDQQAYMGALPEAGQAPPVDVGLIGMRLTDAITNNPQANAAVQQAASEIFDSPDQARQVGQTVMLALQRPELYDQIATYLAHILGTDRSELSPMFDRNELVTLLTLANSAANGLVAPPTPGQQPQPPAQQMSNGGLIDWRIQPVRTYGSGGMVQGKGTGTSDSIPGVNVNSGTKVAVSNGEFIVPADVVRAKGTEFFQTLIDKYHTPTTE